MQEPPAYRDAVFRMLFPGKKHPGREAVDDMLSNPSKMRPTAYTRDVHFFLPEFYQSSERTALQLMMAGRLPPDETVDAILRMMMEGSRRQGTLLCSASCWLWIGTT